MTSATKNRLLGLTNQLAADWAAARDSWQDAKALEFETRFIEELMGSVNAAITHIDALERTLNKVRSDCE